MFGLQKQRRNAAGGGAWFIAGHLTVFAKLSHHAVPLESRIFSSRCFSFSVPPPYPSSLLSLSPPLSSRTPYRRDSCTSLPLTIRRRQHTLIDPRRHDLPPGSRSSLRKIRSGCERISEFPWPRETQMDARTRRCPNSFAHVPYIPHITSAVNARGKGGDMRYLLRVLTWLVNLYKSSLLN